MKSSIATFREIARVANVSLSTVSCALRNRPNVAKATQKRIAEVARQLGYVPNPVFASMMSRHRRRTSQRKIQAVLGCMISRESLGAVQHHSTGKELILGMETACAREGFLCEKFIWEDFGDSRRRLFATLNSRKMPGVIFLSGKFPAWASRSATMTQTAERQEKSSWERYALASLGISSDGLNIHYSSADQYTNACLALSHLEALGYKRIGFVLLEHFWGMRSHYKSLSAYAGWVARGGFGGERRRNMPPPFLTKSWERDEFARWLERHRPDALLVANNEPVEFLHDAGWRMPEDIGVAHLDLDVSWKHLAGIRQNNFEVGQAATHLVIEQINRGAYGEPQHARAVLVTGDWFFGPSVTHRSEVRQPT